MKIFRQRFAHMGSRRGMASLIRELDNSICSGDLGRALAFLNELELESGDSHPDYPVYEEELRKAFEIYSKDIFDTDPLLTQREQKDLNTSSIETYKNLHSGQSCFILGTGPSLAQIDPEILSGEITFGMNLLCKTANKRGFKPSYYVAEDRHILEYCSEDIAALTSCKVFLPNYARQIIRQTPNQIHVNSVRYESGKAELPCFGLNADRRIWLTGSAAYMAMQLAYYMGFSTIYLLGFDHDYKIPSQSILSIDNEIIYREQEQNHFPDARFPQNYIWRLPRLNMLDCAYEQARHVYEKHGRKIINCTPTSKLRLFPLKDITEAIKSPLRQERPGISKKEKILSIIVPYRPARQAIKKCHEALSLLSENAQILFVNYGSRANIEEDFAECTPGAMENFEIIQNDSESLASALNAGLKNAKKPYVLFMQPESFIIPGIVTDSAAKMKCDQIEILQMRGYSFKSNDALPTIPQVMDFHGTDALKKLINSESLNIGGKIFSTALLQKNGLRFYEWPFDENPIFILQSYYFAGKTGFSNLNAYFSASLEYEDLGSEIDFSIIKSNIGAFHKFLLDEKILPLHYSLYIKFIYRIFIKIYTFFESADPNMTNHDHMLFCKRMISEYDLANPENLRIMENELERDLFNKIHSAIFTCPISFL